MKFKLTGQDSSNIDCTFLIEGRSFQALLEVLGLAVWRACKNDRTKIQPNARFSFVRIEEVK